MIIKASPKPPARKNRLDFITELPLTPPPASIVSPDQEALANLNFKVPKMLHRAFKGISNELDLSMVDFLQLCLDSYVDANLGKLGDLAPVMQKYARERSRKG